MAVCSITGEGIDELKEKMARIEPDGWQKETIVGDLVSPQDLVMLVTPIDEAMPKNQSDLKLKKKVKVNIKKNYQK